MKKNIRLTLKTAKALIKQEFGISGSALETERAGEGVYIYKMELGRFEITVSNDWFDKNGLISLQVSSNTREGMWLFYNPDTLEENYEACENCRAEIRAEQCEGCALYWADKERRERERNT